MDTAATLCPFPQLIPILLCGGRQKPFRSVEVFYKMPNKYVNVVKRRGWDLQAYLCYVCNKCGAWKRDPVQCISCDVDDLFDEL